MMRLSYPLMPKSTHTFPGRPKKKIAELSSRYTFVCDTDQSKWLVKATRAQIDRDIEEVRSLCRACLFC
jgi:hypothetical protein